MLFLLMLLIFLPLQLSFDIGSVQLTGTPLLIAFVPDIVFKFNKGFYSEGLLVTERIKIFWNYIEGRFYWDFLLLCIYLIAFLMNISWLKTLILLRCLEIATLYREIDERFRIRYKFGGVAELVQLVSFVILIAHVIACAWNAFAFYEVDNNIGGDPVVTWLGDLISYDWRTRYVNSLYWAFVTMTTIGYGDITPHTTAEKVFVICVVLVTSFTFGYSVNEIGAILKDFGSKQLAFRERMAHLNAYMEKRGIDGGL